MGVIDRIRADFALDEAQAAALGRYLRILLDWRRANVTGVRGEADAADRLLADSLALLDVPALAAAGPRWADLGAGAGVPGIPLAVARADARLTLVESVAKKCDFLEEAVAAAGLAQRARVVRARSEAFAARGAGGREAFDVVLARAVAALPAVVELAAPLLAPGGVLLAVKTAQGAAAEGPGGEAAAAACGLAAGAVVPLTRSPLDGSVCVVYGKVAPTPEWLPRRPGFAVKRPLSRRPAR